MKKVFKLIMAILSIMLLIQVANTQVIQAAETMPIYRIYNPNTGEHFHTMSWNEKSFLEGIGWKYEGVSMRVNGEGQDVYRIYNPNSGEHFYTLNWNEIEKLKKYNWRYEGIAWKTPWSGDAVYRVYNPNSVGAGAHHYTLNWNEVENLKIAGWKYEGVAWYAIVDTTVETSKILNVPYVSQYTPIKTPWGCAAASMTMLLRYTGANVNLSDAQNNLPMYPTVVDGQKGNVYTGVGFGWVIKPSGLARYAQKWNGNVVDVTGISVEGIKRKIDAEKPVLYYGYSSYDMSARNHVKVIVGYKGDSFLVYDPLYYSQDGAAMSRGKNKYDRGAQAWVPLGSFLSEWDGGAISLV